ncbi:hypothetical protein [Actinomycetospora termitidis]|uniref:Uncharacterized protein n=1 Tax=Actinomycetospora termitidis TaxID=3053470 RepID=A0ABT7MFI9_9PSEU|nr:hypothetical protein [Actinomycetospora sp. Odt1-22]MDL5158939.1 hypothetical protein [Actinomycetospora sp. Odt1-22]
MGGTRISSYRESIGALILRFHRRVEGPLCDPCRSRYFWTFTGVSSLFGWLGIISFCYTLFVLPSNIVQQVKERGGVASASHSPYCFRCGYPGLGSAPPPARLVAAGVIGGIVVLFLLFGLASDLASGRVAAAVVLLVLLVVVSLSPVGLVFTLVQQYRRCTRCGNEQR